MIFDILAKTINILLKQKKEKIASDSDILQIQKRQLFHKDIPDLTTIKKITGENFNELLLIFIRYNPIKTEDSQENPRKYEFITRTVIYKLPTKRTRQAIADLLSLEFSLWFKHAYNDFDKKEELIDEVIEFKLRHLRTDPFDRNQTY
jgi:hypothetical protein